MKKYLIWGRKIKHELNKEGKENLSLFRKGILKIFFIFVNLY